MRKKVSIIAQYAYAELVCVLPKQGITSLFRGSTYQEALAFRCNHAMRTYQGKKVALVETQYATQQKKGLLVPCKI